MTNQTDTHQPESKTSSARLLLNFAKVFLVIFLLQMPGCIVVCSSDAGQIEYTKHEKLIEFSNATFAFPLKLLISPANGWGSLLFVYFGNILLLSCFVLFLLFLWRRVRRNT
jgi:hypothetical protein